MSIVKRFGAVGDGQADDTEAIRHAVRDGDGVLHFPPGSYRITSTIEVALEKQGPFGVDGMNGGARIINAGPGPAFRVVGTHNGTGDPLSAKGNVFPSQRMPILQNIEVEGAHPEADGVELIKTTQATLAGVQVRKCRHGVLLRERNRNVLVTHCHIYFNRGAGVFLDRVNLHQINIAANHISYNRLGGVRIEGSEIRNLQITGNDIEYNNHQRHGAEPEPTAEIWIDTRAEGASVNEVTVASNTIQATPSAGGANLRIWNRNDESRPPGLWAISGNIIGNQEHNVHLTGCYGVALSGNCIYSAEKRNLLLEDCEQVAVSGNIFRRHTPRLFAGVHVMNSRDCAFSGCQWRDEDPEGQASKHSLLELTECERVTVTGCQFAGGAPYAIDGVNCSMLNISGSTFADTHDPIRSRGAIRLRGVGKSNLIASCAIGETVEQTLQFDENAGVSTTDLVGDFRA